MPPPVRFSIFIGPCRGTYNANIVEQPLPLTVTRGKTIIGVVEQIEQLGAAGRQSRYLARMIPALGRRAYRMTSRTFGDLNPVQIVQGLLNETGVPDSKHA